MKNYFYFHIQIVSKMNREIPQINTLIETNLGNAYSYSNVELPRLTTAQYKEAFYDMRDKSDMFIRVIHPFRRRDENNNAIRHECQLVNATDEMYNEFHGNAEGLFLPEVMNYRLSPTLVNTRFYAIVDQFGNWSRILPVNVDCKCITSACPKAKNTGEWSYNKYGLHIPRSHIKHRLPRFMIKTFKIDKADEPIVVNVNNNNYELVDDENLQPTDENSLIYSIFTTIHLVCDSCQSFITYFLYDFRIELNKSDENVQWLHGIFQHEFQERLTELCNTNFEELFELPTGSPTSTKYIFNRKLLIENTTAFEYFQQQLLNVITKYEPTTIIRHKIYYHSYGDHW